MNAVKTDKYEEGESFHFVISDSVSKANGCGF